MSGSKTDGGAPAPLVMWQTLSYRHAQVTRCEVVRQTPHFIVYRTADGREVREKKATAFGMWHESYAEARAYLVERAGKRCDAAERVLEERRKELREAFAMPETEPVS